MQVIGDDPIQRLVVDAVLASMLVADAAQRLVSSSGVRVGITVFNVRMQGGQARVPLWQFPGLGQVPDPGGRRVKALVFGAGWPRW